MASDELIFLQTRSAFIYGPEKSVLNDEQILLLNTAQEYAIFADIEVPVSGGLTLTVNNLFEAGQLGKFILNERKVIFKAVVGGRERPAQNFTFFLDDLAGAGVQRIVPDFNAVYGPSRSSAILSSVAKLDAFSQWKNAPKLFVQKIGSTINTIQTFGVGRPSNVPDDAYYLDLPAVVLPPHFGGGGVSPGGPGSPVPR